MSHLFTVTVTDPHDLIGPAVTIYRGRTTEQVVELAKQAQANGWNATVRAEAGHASPPTGRVRLPRLGRRKR